MARPVKFRLTPDDVLDPQHARKLAGHVSEIEFFRGEVEKLQAQIAGVYDAADDDGFDKKFIRKTVARRAKESGEIAAEEYAVGNYAMAVEKGLATRVREENSKSPLPPHDEITGEVLEDTTQESHDDEPVTLPLAVDDSPLTGTGGDIGRSQISNSSDAGKCVTEADPGNDGIGPKAAVGANVGGENVDHRPLVETVEKIAFEQNADGAAGALAPGRDVEVVSPILQFGEARPLRPNCLKPNACSGQGRMECWSCRKAAGVAA